MADRQLKVTLVGDSKQLERTLGRAETRLQKFGRHANAVSGGAGVGQVGLLGLATKSNLAVGGLAALGYGFLKASKAARESEVILGQTGNAARQAGLDWAATSKQVEAAADRISKGSGFDDEKVLQSFSVFVRGQKDVGKSIQLSSLAADVARGRYTDLETATQLVNKAAMGQVGALRRAGIQIDKTATSAQALDALQRAYSGSAKTYAETAAGGIDKLKVSWDNLLEDIGKNAGPATGNTAGFFSSVIDWTDKAFTSASNYYQKLLEIERKLGVPGIKATVVQPGTPSAGLAGAHPGEGRLGAGGARSAAAAAALAAATKPGKGATATQRNQWFDAKIAREIDIAQDLSLKAQVAALKGVKGEVQAQLAKTKDPTRRLNLTDEIRSIDREIKGVNEQISSNLQDAAAKVKAGKEKLAAKFKADAVDIKSAVLSLFDTGQDKISNSREVADAKEALRIARQGGGAGGIQAATRRLEDANAAVARQKLEGTPFTVSQGPKGPVNTLTVGNVSININGAGDPALVAKAVLAALQKMTKNGVAQSRGTVAGRNFNAGIY